MQTQELIRGGQLDDAIKSVSDEVRNAPSEAKHRVLLFQSLCVLGKWDKVLTQLNVAAEMDPKTLLMAQVCRAALSCEAFRAEVFAGKRTPLVFGEPADWVGWLVQATHLVAGGKFAEAAEMRDCAFDAAPAISGKIGDTPFEWLADADNRLGPILEAIVDGRYFWVPLSSIHKITTEAPQDLRDLVWLPANFIWSNGGTAVGLIPLRYPNSEHADDSAIKLARRTDFIPAGDTDLAIGIGQRLFATDQGEYPILETREITIGEAPAQIVTDRDDASKIQLNLGANGG